MIIYCFFYEINFFFVLLKKNNFKKLFCRQISMEIFSGFFDTSMPIRVEIGGPLMSLKSILLFGLKLIQLFCHQNSFKKDNI